MNTCRSGQNLILVPVARRTLLPCPGRLSWRSPDFLVKSASGPGLANSPVTPRRKLAARVQPGHHQLHAGELGLALDVNRDAAAVVPDLGRTIRVQGHLDPGAVPGQRLVHGVVEDLTEAVLKPAAVGRPDVHAGALADRLQALEDRQVPGGVSVSRSGVRGRPGRGEGGHSRPISLREMDVAHTGLIRT